MSEEDDLFGKDHQVERPEYAAELYRASKAVNFVTAEANDKTWRSRWGVVYDKKLYLYKSRDTYRNKKRALGSLVLSEADLRLVHGSGDIKYFQFFVRTGAAVWHLSTKSQDSLEKWVTILHEQSRELDMLNSVFDTLQYRLVDTIEWEKSTHIETYTTKLAQRLRDESMLQVLLDQKKDEIDICAWIAIHVKLQNSMPRIDPEVYKAMSKCCINPYVTRALREDGSNLSIQTAIENWLVHRLPPEDPWEFQTLVAGDEPEEFHIDMTVKLHEKERANIAEEREEQENMDDEQEDAYESGAKSEWRLRIPGSLFCD